MELREVSDRVEIQAALTRYATGVDSKNWGLWQTVFTEDADVDYTNSTPLRGTPTELAAWYEVNFAPVPWTMHYVTNVDITFDGAEDAAKVTAMFYNPCLLPGQDATSYFGGYYHHDFVRTPQGWRSKHLVEEMVWWVNHPVRGTSSTAPTVFTAAAR